MNMVLTFENVYQLLCLGAIDFHAVLGNKRKAEVGCSVLQCVAVCCSVLQCVAVRPRWVSCVLQCVAVCCSEAEVG